MKIKLNLSLKGNELANWAIYLIVILTCLPLSMVLPSIIRIFLQLLAAGLFFISLIIMRKYIYLLSLLGLFSCSYLYFIGSWEEMMRASTFLYNSLCCWISVLYGVLCVKGVIKPFRSFFWLVVIITLLTAVTTNIGLTQYPLAVRELGRELSYAGIDIRSLYRTQNIASWSQVYGMVFFLGSFIYFFKDNRSKIVMVTIVMTELCILRSQLTFGILLSIVIIVLTIINAKSIKNYIVVFSALIILMAILFNLNSVLLWSIDFSEQVGLRMLTPKLTDLYNVLIYGSVTGDAAVRFDLYTMSLSGLIQYPFGLFLYRDIRATNYIGYHSELFDVIGTLGIWGVLIICVCILTYAKIISRLGDKYRRRFAITMFLAFGIIFVLNPVFYSPQIWIGAFVLPSVLIHMQFTNTHLSEFISSRRKKKA